MPIIKMNQKSISELKRHTFPYKMSNIKNSSQWITLKKIHITHKSYFLWSLYRSGASVCVFFPLVGFWVLLIHFNMALWLLCNNTIKAIVICAWLTGLLWLGWHRSHLATAAAVQIPKNSSSCSTFAGVMLFNILIFTMPKSNNKSCCPVQVDWLTLSMRPLNACYSLSLRLVCSSVIQQRAAQHILALKMHKDSSRRPFILMLVFHHSEGLAFSNGFGPTYDHIIITLFVLD